MERQGAPGDFVGEALRSTRHRSMLYRGYLLPPAPNC